MAESIRPMSGRDAALTAAKAVHTTARRAAYQRRDQAFAEAEQVCCDELKDVDAAYEWSLIEIDIDFGEPVDG